MDASEKLHIHYPFFDYHFDTSDSNFISHELPNFK